jgi:GNAT superfamily N-acetyltransferase
MAVIMFRQAQASDIEAIVGLLADDELGRRREVLSSPPDPQYLAAFDAIAADRNQLLAVAIEQGAVIGTLQLSFIPGMARRGAWRGQIEAVRIAAHRRSGGVGQQMFEWAIAACRARGCAMVQLTTDKARPDAHRFYEKLGFVASHEGFKLLF